MGFKLTKIVKKFFFVFGCLLLIINIYGEFRTLRNDKIHTSIKDIAKFDEKSLYERLDKTSMTTEKIIYDYNTIVNEGISHYWDTTDEFKMNLHVPIWENYILFALSFTGDSRFRNYEFSNYSKAIERGVGLCSQQSIILSELLLRKKIPSKIIGLDGHVVVSAQLDKDTWWILDPDYGVVIPHNIEEIEADPLLVENYYKDAGYNSPEHIINIYRNDGNVIPNGYGASGYTPRKYYIEYIFYILKWVLPLVLIFPFIFSSCKKQRHKVLTSSN